MTLCSWKVFADVSMIVELATNLLILFGLIPSLKAITRSSSATASRVGILGIAVGRGLFVSMFKTASKMEKMQFILFLISSMEWRESWRTMFRLPSRKCEASNNHVYFDKAQSELALFEKFNVRILTLARHLSNKLTKNCSLTDFLRHFTQPKSLLPEHFSDFVAGDDQ